MLRYLLQALHGTDTIVQDDLMTTCAIVATAI
jgi:hypothetical protein